MTSLNTIETGKRTAGRRQVAYRTTWHEDVHGLHKDKDGRWRIVLTNERYTEADERLAVKRFRDWQERNHLGPVRIVELTGPLHQITENVPPADGLEANPPYTAPPPTSAYWPNTGFLNR